MRRAWHEDVRALGAEIVTLSDSKPQRVTPGSTTVKYRRRVAMPSALAWAVGLGREVATLRRLFIQRRLDLPHSNNAGAEPAPIAARLANVPRVIAIWHVDSTYDLLTRRSGWKYRLLEMTSMRALHHSISVSEATARDWIHRADFADGPVSVSR